MVTLNLTINNSISSTASASICQGNSYTFGSQTLNTAGTYTEVFTGQNGCDSTVTLTLTVNPTFSATATADICDGDTYVFGIQSLNSSGTYTEVFTSQSGCDSTVTLTLNVTSVDTSVSVSNNTLTANAAGASYQWIDCDNANAPIPGETNQSFTATQNGNYAVVVTENNCSDTSGCYAVVVIALGETLSEEIRIYPNPAKDRLFVDNPEEINIQRIRIVSISGVELFIQDVMKEPGNGIDITKLSSGMYHLIIEGKDFKEDYRFVKE